MKVEIIQTGNLVTATLEGRLDTMTSTDFEKSLTPYYSMPAAELILDCNSMEYIRSEEHTSELQSLV